jgi:NADH-quinone oxidoreductase subunit B
VNDKKSLPVVQKPEGNVPESPFGDERVLPLLMTRRDEAISWFENNLRGKAEAAASNVLGWARKNSIFQYPFVTACCGMEYMSAMAGRYDIARFGAEFPRFSPRQADLLMIVGTINIKQSPILKMVYEQMAEPKWVMAFGVCASSGGFYDNYATVQGADRVIPVDVYVPGCPPRPEQVLDGLKILQEKIQTQRHRLRTVERSEESQARLDSASAERSAERKKKSFLGKLLAR